MGKVKLMMYVFIVFIHGVTYARVLPNDSKCRDGVYPEFLSAYKFWNSESENLPIREIMEQVNCLLNDFKAMEEEVFELRRKLHKRRHKH